MNLESIVKGYITNAIAEKVGETLGLSASTSKMLAAKVVPLILGGMAKNATQDKSAAAGLFGAITKDHDGSIFRNLENLINDPKALKGDKILSHVLGKKEGRIEKALAADSGVKKAQATDFMQMMAPLVMGALGKEQTKDNLESTHLAKMFEQEQAAVKKQQATNPLLAMLDKEGNGVADDLLSMRMSFLKKR